MLKRAAALSVSLLYLITATGFALNLHFCGDNVTVISIDAAAKTLRGCGDGMPCCHSKHLVVKVKDVHLAQPHTAKAKLYAFSIAPLCYTPLSFSPKQGISHLFVNKPPPDPPLPCAGAFLKNCVFRI